MRIFNIKKPIINAICFIFVIIGIITCSYILTYDFSEVFESTVTDNYTDGLLFAVYVNTDDGYKEYSEVYGEELTNFSNLTSLKFTSSECRDYDNNVLSNVLTYNKGVINVDTTTTTYCTLYFEIYELDCVSEGLDLAECILRSENNFQSEEDAIEYIEEKGTPNFATSATTDEGLYVAEDDYGDSYYFRGTAEDNYVSFAGFYWRIVRINGDGSIRLIYDGTEKHENGDTSKDKGINSSTYQYNYLSTKLYPDVAESVSNGLVGYMYGDDLFSLDTQTETTSQIALQTYYYYSSECNVTSNGRLELGDDAYQAVWNESLEGKWTTLSESNDTTFKQCYYISEYTDKYNGVLEKYVVSDGEKTLDSVIEDPGNLAKNITYFSTYTLDTIYGIYYFDEDGEGEIVTDYYYNGSSDIVGYYTCNTNHSDCSTLFYVESVVADNSAQVNVYTSTATALDYDSTHANQNDSNAKSVIDNWYYTNIYSEQDDYGNDYSDYISDTLFCGDRSLYKETGIGTVVTYYGAYNRLSVTKTPVLTCERKNDSFTVSNTTYGNAALKYPIALISADEVVMAGASTSSTSSTSISSYLARYSSFTMSAAYFNRSAYIYKINSYGNITAGSVATSSLISPVINLKSSVVVTGGTGTIDDPYTVSLS